MSKHILTADELRAQLSYDPLTGVFTRRVSNSSRTWVGQVAGTRNGLGYLQMYVSGLHLAHRLAWLYVHGRWPTTHIDHINGERMDNRIANLREATPLQNQFNRKLAANNTSGYRGVTWEPTKKRWAARAYVEGKPKRLGTYATPEQAYQAYCDFVTPMHGEFFRAS